MKTPEMVPVACLIMCFSGLGWAQESKLPDLTVPEGDGGPGLLPGAWRTWPLSKNCAKALSPGGRVHLFRASRKLRGQSASRGRWETIRQMLPALTQTRAQRRNRVHRPLDERTICSKAFR